MKNNKYVPLIILLVSICSMAFLYGCGTVAGGGGGGGAATLVGTYFANIDTCRVYYISPEGITRSGTIELGPRSPYDMIAGPDGKLYVSTDSLEVVVIDTASNTITGLITTDAYTWSRGMAMSSDGRYLYIARPGNVDFIRIDLASGNTYDKVSVGGTSRAVHLSPDGSKLYVGGPNRYIYVYDVANLTAVATIDFGSTSYYCNNMDDKDGKIYAALHNNKVAVIDPSNDSFVLLTGEAGRVYFDVVGIPGSHKLYVSDSSSTGHVDIINATVPTIEATVTGSLSNPDYMAATNDGLWVSVMDFVGHNGIYYITTTSESVISDHTTIPNASLGWNNIVLVYK